MNHFDNSKTRLEDDFDWSVLIDLFATMSAIMILILAYVSYSKYQVEDNLSLLTKQAKIQNNILSDFAEKNKIAEGEKQVLAKNVDILQEELGSSAVFQEQQSEELISLKEDQILLKETLEKTVEHADKNFQKTYEAFKILKVLDTSKDDQTNDISSTPMSKDILADDLLHLAQRIKKAEAHKSVFKEKMAPLVEKQDIIEIIDDRFILSSEVLFPSGSPRLTMQGRKALEPVVKTLKNIVKEAPEDLDWIIRIDGHADRLPVLRKNLSNRELSAQRSLEIVKHLENRGIPAKRLVATAFGSHYPRSEGTNSADLAKDRRIEIKITNR